MTTRKSSRSAPHRKAASTKSKSHAAGHRKGSAARTKDPHGGLTAAGRRKFARTEGAHLQPGVKKPVSEMTPAEMKRKGSWAVRFYGREKLSPLKAKDGSPTRFALTAAAWGEPVPKTEAAARRIAAKGHKLLERYKRSQSQRRDADSRARSRSRSSK